MSDFIQLDLPSGNHPLSSSLPELVEKFLDYLKVEKNASLHTLDNYQRDLRHFFSFLFRQSSPFELAHFEDLKLLRKFLAKELKSYERATVLRRLSCIKSFLKFLHREKLLSQNIAKLIQLPRPEEKVPKTLSPEKVQGLIDDLPAVTLKEKRLKAILETLYSTGIRVSELVQLNQLDVDLTGRTLKVRGKGNKERIVPIGNHCAKALDDYHQAMDKKYALTGNPPVFLNQDGARMSVRTVQRDVKQFCIQVLGKEGLAVTPHTFRHSCASHLLAFGAGLREIQLLLGHVSLLTTQKYTHIDSRKLKEVYNRTHPRQKKKEN